MHLICIYFLEALGIYVSPLNAPQIPLFLLTCKSGCNNNQTLIVLTNEHMTNTRIVRKAKARYPRKHDNQEEEKCFKGLPFHANIYIVKELNKRQQNN